VWRCHNVLRQHVIPHALGTPRSLAKECRLAEAENGITDFFARRVHTDELCIKATCVEGAARRPTTAGAPTTVGVSGAAGGSTSDPEGTGTEPPTLTIKGNNPTTITVGDSYADLAPILDGKDIFELSVVAFGPAVLTPAASTSCLAAAAQSARRRTSQRRATCCDL